MNLALILEGDLHVGGGFQQQLSTILGLKNIGNYSLHVFVFSNENRQILSSMDINTHYIKTGYFDKLVRFVNRQEIFYGIVNRFNIRTKLQRVLLGAKIDLVYFLSPSSYALDLTNHNFIITNWDLSHRDTPEFPEVNFNREFEYREFLYTRVLKKAVAVLVDSEMAKRNVERRYGVDLNRIHVAPFVPSINISTKKEINIKEKYNIKGEYIYYPAQLWSHKNHVYIIQALKKLKEQNVQVTAIFSGSDKGNLHHIINYSKLENVEELVRYIGFAPNEEIYSLYKQSLAMVMPSYFGPTNIPPLEAFAVGTPVVYSNIDGLREQVGDAAMLCDLRNPNDLAQKIISLNSSSELRQALIEKGRQRLSVLQKETVIEKLTLILDDYATKLKCWRM